MNASFSNSHVCQTVSDAALPIQKPRVSYQRCLSETNSWPLMSLVARSQKCSQTKVQKLFLGPWNVQKLLLPIATYCYLLQCSWVSFHDCIAAATTRSEWCFAWCFFGSDIPQWSMSLWVSSCKPCHRRMRCCDLGIRKNTVVPNLFVNWWCLVSFPHCIDHYFWTILSRVALHRKGEDPWVAQPCWVVQEISVWFGLEKSANAHQRIG